MGADPKTSAVNRYLQSWDVPNVFVIGASAFAAQCGDESRPARWGRWPTGRRRRSPPNTSRIPARWCLHEDDIVVVAGFRRALATPAFADDAGRYQAVLGDCAGCHGKDLSGGVTLMTPFGKLVTPNITPDKDTGIGNYSANDFRAAMKDGVAPGGKRLYPAMPYPYYAKMSDGDIAALWSYLKTVKPVQQERRCQPAAFPFNLRIMMAGWNMMLFRTASRMPMTRQKCSLESRRLSGQRARPIAAPAIRPRTCWAPTRGPLTGAVLQGWYAPDITSDQNAGLGRWSAADIVDYLQTGRNAHAIASGPMAEAVEDSTSQ